MSQPIFKDRILETSTSIGAGDFSLLGAITSFRDFSNIGDGNQCFYKIQGVNSYYQPTGEWEVGLGQYTSAGSLLKRLQVTGSSAGLTVPTIASIGAVANADTTTSLATNAPPGVEIGDTLVLVATTSPRSRITSIPNWGPFIFSDIGSNTDVVVATRIADGTSNDTPTLSISGGTADVTAIILRVTNAGYIDIINNITIASTTTPSIKTITTSYANELLIGIIRIASAARTWTATPSGWTEILEQDSTLTIKGLGIWSKSAPTAGIYGGENATISATSLAASITIAIRPGYPKINFSTGTKFVSNVPSAHKVSLPDIQIFTSNGIWKKPPGATTVDVGLVGGGSGGGSGRATSVGNSVGGGGAGSGGAITIGRFSADMLNDTEAVTIGIGGIGGVAASATGATGGGSNGNSGTNTIFGNYLQAAGAGGGGGATASGGSGGTAAGTTSFMQQAGANGGAGGTADVGGTTPSSSTTVQCTGGGGGGGVATAAQQGGVGGSIATNTVTGSAIAGGTRGSSSAGGDGNSSQWIMGIPIGTGGGGGASNFNSGAGITAYPGGNGGNYGGGGGGGGGAICVGGTAISGAGGDGAPGIAVIITT